MKDWKMLAQALDLDIPEADVEKIAPSLNSLDAAFAPLCARLRPEVEPATAFFSNPGAEA